MAPHLLLVPSPGGLEGEAKVQLCGGGRVLVLGRVSTWTRAATGAVG